MAQPLYTTFKTTSRPVMGSIVQSRLGKPNASFLIRPTIFEKQYLIAKCAHTFAPLLVQELPMELKSNIVKQGARAISEYFHCKYREGVAI